MSPQKAGKNIIPHKTKLGLHKPSLQASIVAKTVAELEGSRFNIER